MDLYQDETLKYYLKNKSFLPDTSIQEKRRVIARSCCYSFDSGVFLYKGLIVPPPDERKEIIKRVHESMGHVGTQRTIDATKKKYFWSCYRDDIKDFVNGCYICQFSKASSSTLSSSLIQEISLKAWSTVAIDLCHPPWSLDLPENQLPLGFRYMLVAVDKFSRWIEIILLKSKSSEEISVKFEQDILFRYGAPLEIVSDNDLEFKGAFDDLLSKWNINHLRSRPYHPQGNGFGEAAVRVIKDRLFAKLLETGLDIPWYSLVAEVQFQYNTSYHTSTKCTPFSLMFNREANSDLLHNEFAVCQSLKSAELQKRSYINRVRTKKAKNEPVVAGNSVLWIQPKSLNKKKITGPFVVKKVSLNGNWITVFCNGQEVTIPREETSIFIP